MTVVLASGLLLLGLFGYTLRPMLLAPVSIPLTADASCDLNREPCRAMLPEGGRLTVQAGTHPIPMLKAFPVEVVVEGAQADKVEMDFTGVEMNMGLNRVALQPQGGASEFRGQATLPVCITGAMAWQATVLVSIGRREYSLPLRFESGSHPR